jgi:tRNA A-37 threonylcarbamoyl transferase component Bud32
MSADGDLLDTGSVVPYLAARGLLRDPGHATAVALAGGISNVVLAVGDGVDDADDGAVVVKQSLSRLRVRDEWRAPRERVLTEADALELAGKLTPGVVPRVLDRDTARNVIVLERAPAGWTDWKSELLSGRADPGVARRLGQVLAAWHADTSTGGLPERFADALPFEQLRVSPYYRTVAERLPDLAEPVGAYVEAMAGRRRCLVHGDFSPKNVLVGGAGAEAALWVLDFEVAHLGDPAFDLAFLLSHLTLKAVHVPTSAAALDECASRFAAAYEDGVTETLRPDWAYVLGHVGCLLVARVDGKSPAEYLTEPERARVRDLGRQLLADPPPDIAGLATARGTRGSRPS